MNEPLLQPPQQPLQADGSGAMFDLVAPRYDLLNKLMSFGVDALWRRRLVRQLKLRPDAHVLDVATGTADVALAVCQRHGDAQVTGIDPSAAMLQVATQKIKARGLQQRLRTLQGDAQAMPFADQHFDAVCISFGIRNVPDRLRALREMARVCKPGGPVAVLELTEPLSGLVAPLARWHVHTAVPWLGARLSGAAQYAYLQRSIAAFPTPQAFVGLMQQAGLHKVQVQSMGFGAVHLFCGFAASP